MTLKAEKVKFIPIKGKPNTWATVYDKKTHICFDFKVEEIPQLICALKDLETTTFKVIKETQEEADRHKKIEEHFDKWYIKLYRDVFKHIGIQVTPFHWGFSYGGGIGSFMVATGGLVIGPARLHWMKFWGKKKYK